MNSKSGAKKKKLRKQDAAVYALIALAAIVSIGMILYPAVSNIQYERKTDTIITDYEEDVESTDEETIKTALLQAETYNETLKNSSVVMTDPFQATSSEEMSEEYMKSLNLYGDGIMGYIEIPSISVKLNIFHGTSEESLQNGVGHLENSSLPVGGTSTHCVLTGHTGIQDKKLFTDIDKLVEGDTFFLHILDETLTYEVDQILVVEPYDTSALQIVNGQDYCTLVTCTPYGVNSHRLLVRGHRIETPVDDEGNAVTTADEEHGSTWADQYRKSVIIGLSAAGGIIITATVADKVITRKKKATGKGGQGHGEV